MPERKPNQFARVIAVATLILAFVVVIFTIATASDDSDGGGAGETDQTEASDPTSKGERAIDEGVWIVDEGDTLVSISEATGIDLDTLVELNPDIDPQTLSTGQRIGLRQGLNEGGSDSESDGGTVSEGAGIGDGTGEGDGGPTLDNAGASDGIPGN